MRKRKRNNGLWLFRSDRLELKGRETHLLSSSTPTGTDMGFMSQAHFSTGPYSQLEKEMETYSSSLAWRIPRTEEPDNVKLLIFLCLLYLCIVIADK